MRWLFLLMLVAGCDAGSSDENASAPAAVAGTPAGAVPPTSAAGGTAQLEERARTALGLIVADPKSMRFGELKPGAAGAVCGRVEARQPDGKPGVRPFVVTPEGVAVISTSAQVNLTDPEDPFPDFYIRWCASPAELARLQPNLIGGETLGIGAPPPDIPDVPPDLPPDFPASPPDTPIERPAPQAKAGPPPRPPTPTGDDSFFNVVARPDGKED